jgi:hypothetical protein
MSTELHRPTAKIYTFPSGGRAPPPRYREVPKSSAHVASARTASSERAARVQHGSSWYHEEAIEEEAVETCER